MNLAACPNCSAFSEREQTWIIGRPDLMKGRYSGKYFIIGCCGFSNRSTTTYDTEAEAEKGWNNYRSAIAQKRASEGFPRLRNTLAQIDARDADFAQRLRPVPAPESPLSPVPSQRKFPLRVAAEKLLAEQQKNPA